jgi:tRNA nucleotidyltransferase (CCA-adding enzyme)
MVRVTHPLDAVLLSFLPSAEIYAVGGRVRDEFRTRYDGVERLPKDLDYVVAGVSLENLTEALCAVGQVDVVGASFAVLKFRHAAGEADIALPRRERSTGRGHKDFHVQSGPDIPIADDLGRRDFRMNMIARRLRDNTIVDPFGGVRDILARRIDIVTPQTFEEDPLRMLRAAQFAARFDFTVAEGALAAMSACAALVTTVSAERIGEELGKLLGRAKAPSVGLEILRETGVLAHIWPELLEGVGVEQNEWHAYDVYRHNLVTVDATPPGDLTLRLAALLHDVGKPRTKDGPHFYRHEQVGADLVPAMLARLRLAGDVVETVEQLVRHHMYVADPDLAPKAIRRFIRRVGPHHLARQFALRAADIRGSGLPKRDDTNERFEASVNAVLAEHPPQSVADLAIGGEAIIAEFVRQGKAKEGFRGDQRVGGVLATLLEYVTDDPTRNAAPDLAREAARVVAGF